MVVKLCSSAKACVLLRQKKNKFKLEIDVLSEIRNDFFIGGG